MWGGRRVFKILHALPPWRPQVPRHFSLQVIAWGMARWYGLPTLSLRRHNGRPDSRHRIIQQVVQPHNGPPRDWRTRGGDHWAAWHRYVFVAGFTLRPMSYRRICSPGKSNFPKFVLAWLLSKQQVVLLCCSAHAYLFHRDMVYFQPTSLTFLGLPVHREHPNRCLWTHYIHYIPQR